MEKEIEFKKLYFRSFRQIEDFYNKMKIGTIVKWENKKYLIDTDENKKFLEDVRNGLLKFGHAFPSPGGGSYYLGDDGTPWKDRNRETWNVGWFC